MKLPITISLFVLMGLGLISTAVIIGSILARKFGYAG